jgi:hypothetical protein
MRCGQKTAWTRDETMHDSEQGTRYEAWRLKREARRAAWRARRAARHAGRGDWSHFGDPKFWGLDAESMKHWGFGAGMNGGMGQGQGMGSGMGMPGGEMAALQAKVAEMEKTIASMQQRIIVLEKLVVDDDARLAREIEKLRDAPARPGQAPEKDK